jgi:hypothetical protein
MEAASGEEMVSSCFEHGLIRLCFEWLLSLGLGEVPYQQAFYL